MALDFPASPTNGQTFSGAGGVVWTWDGAKWNAASYAAAGPYLPLAGGTMAGKLTTVAPATPSAGFTLPHGTAPTTLVNGDVWTTTAGLYARINGATVGPFGAAGGSYLPLTGGTLTGPLTVDNSTAGNWVALTGVAAGSAPTITSGGTNTDVGLNIALKGNGRLGISSVVDALNSIVVGPSAGAKLILQGNASASGSTYIAASGGAANSLVLQAAGAGAVYLSGSSDANWLAVTGAGNGSAPTIGAFGLFDTNVNINITPLGTGAVVASGPVFTPASSTGAAGLRLPHGSAPTTPTNGDVWTTTAGLYARVNGATVGPFGAAGGSYVPIDGSVAMTGPLQLPIGTQSQPSIQFGSNSTGIYSSAGDVRIVVGTSTLFQVSSTAITGLVPFVAQPGSQTAPSHTFAFESNTGMYRSAAGILSFSVVGTNRFKIDSNTSQITSTYQIVAPASTTGLASLSIPHGTAPTTPVNGDVWTTTAGMYARVNGATVGPFGAGSAGITTITAGGVLSGGTITNNTGTIGLTVGTGLTSAATGTISIAPATSIALGGVIAGVAGSNVSINAGGTISVANPGTGTVTAVTGTAPVVSSGGSAPAISMPAATTSVNGHLTSTDWNTFNNKAPTLSPVFTGDPQAPTPVAGDNDTSIATTAFVVNAITAAGVGQTFYPALSQASDIATYKKLLLSPSTATESSANVITNGTIDFALATFATDPGVPGAVSYPVGSAFRRFYASVSGGTAKLRLQVYKRTSGGTETVVRDELSPAFGDTTAALQEWMQVVSSAGVLDPTDRLVVKLFAQRQTGSPTNVTVTLYTEGAAHASNVQTTIAPSNSTPISATAPLTIASGNISISEFAGSTPGSVPTSVGGITNFLRADGQWQPAGGSYTLPAATTIALGGVIVPASGGLTVASGTITNAGVISLAGGTGTLALGTGLVRNTQTINLQAATGSAIGGVITGTNITNNSGTISVANPGTGTVTSVAQTFTGGLISVAGTPITGAGTLALTVAGTSGGVPYFSGASAWGTSGLLASNGMVLGGGSGAAPKTTAGIATDGASVLSLGTASAAGTLNLIGSTSGTISIKTGAAAAGTFNFNLPTGAGISGQVLTSGGGAGAAMTWGAAPLTSLVQSTGINVSNGNTISVAAATTAALGGVLVPAGGGLGLASGTLSNSGVLSIDTATGAIVIGAGLVRNSQTISVSNTIVLGLANNLTDTLPTGTYDLGPIPQGGTILDGYAHRISGTLTYGAATGAPGTYNDVTGLTAVAVTTASDTITAGSGANAVIAAGGHVYIKVTGTAAVGGVAFLRVKVP